MSCFSFRYIPKAHSIFTNLSNKRKYEPTYLKIIIEKSNCIKTNHNFSFRFSQFLVYKENSSDLFIFKSRNSSSILWFVFAILRWGNNNNNLNKVQRGLYILAELYYVNYLNVYVGCSTHNYFIVLYIFYNTYFPAYFIRWTIFFCENAVNVMISYLHIYIFYTFFIHWTNRWDNSWFWMGCLRVRIWDLVSCIRIGTTLWSRGWLLKYVI